MEIFNAIADPVRRELLALLRDGEQAAGTLVQAVGLPQPNVSKHLKILKEGGLVLTRSEGPRRLYSLNPAPLKELEEWLAPYRTFWADKLDKLGDHLDRTD